MKRLSILWVVFLTVFTVEAQVAPDKYWIQFTDKTNTPFSVSAPEQFLSQRAIDRRVRQNISIEENDLPVDPAYVDSVLNTGAVKLLNKSKWLNAITIETTDANALQLIQALSFVSNVKKAKRYTVTTVKSKFEKPLENYKCNYSYFNKFYGESFTQTKMLNAHYLHEQGFRGEGMVVAVLDAGFVNYETMAVFEQLRAEGRILGTWDFVDGDTTVTEHTHGSYVLSTMAAISEGELIGTGYGASYYLLRTEDGGSECIIEEDNWVAGAEYADSVGADIINSSLGYNEFDDPSQSHVYADLNGSTARATLGANVAASKGIIVVNSAGNNGNDAWYHINVPADGFDMLTVGGVDNSRNYVQFSGKGPTFDGRVKPDVSAVAYGTIVANPGQEEGVIAGSGTSFSAPLIAGAAACLWQAHPKATNLEVMDAIRKSADQYASPDAYTGYGIPDFIEADRILSEQATTVKTEVSIVSVYQDSDGKIQLVYYSPSEEDVTVTLVDVAGKIVCSQNEPVTASTNNYFVLDVRKATLSSGVYIVRVQSESTETVQKIGLNF